MKLLGKEVQVGRKVRLRDGRIVPVKDLPGKPNPLIKVGDETSYHSVNIDGYWIGPRHPDPWDVVEVLDDDPDHFAASPAEMAVYQLRHNLCFMQQERDELREKVDALLKENAALRDGQYAAMEQEADTLRREVVLLRQQKRNDDTEFTALMYERDDLKARVERLETILKGRPG